MAIDVNGPPPATFPLSDVESALDAWWQAEQQDAALPGDQAAGGIMTPAVEIDSHRAVRALLALQEVVRIEIPEMVIRDGGYDDYASMRADLIPRVRALFDRKREKQDA